MCFQPHMFSYVLFFLITYLLFSDYHIQIHHSIHCHAFMLQYISPWPLLEITSTFCYNHMVNTKQFECYNASLCIQRVCLNIWTHFDLHISFHVHYLLIQFTYKTQDNMVKTFIYSFNRSSLLNKHYILTSWYWSDPPKESHMTPGLLL